MSKEYLEKEHMKARITNCEARILELRQQINNITEALNQMAKVRTGNQST